MRKFLFAVAMALVLTSCGHSGTAECSSSIDDTVGAHPHRIIDVYCQGDDNPSFVARQLQNWSIEYRYVDTIEVRGHYMMVFEKREP